MCRSLRSAELDVESLEPRREMATRNVLAPIFKGFTCDIAYFVMCVPSQAICEWQHGRGLLWEDGRWDGGGGEVHEDRPFCLTFHATRPGVKHLLEADLAWLLRPKPRGTLYVHRF